jgi:hypothetical protein
LTAAITRVLGKNNPKITSSMRHPTGTTRMWTVRGTPTTSRT